MAAAASSQYLSAQSSLLPPTNDIGALRRVRSLSSRPTPLPLPPPVQEPLEKRRTRRSSHDEKTHHTRFFLIDVNETERRILEQEDTDGDFQITVKDMGPKSMKLGSAASHGFHKYDIRGTYVLSNLLQELALAKDYGKRYIVIPEAKLNENPVTRLSRMIAHHFWAGLTRAIDRKGVQIICEDPKNRTKDQKPKIYVPHGDDIAHQYYQDMTISHPHLQLEVVRLPEVITPKYVKSLNHHPGLLSLALQRSFDPVTNDEIWTGIPFVVPGGRFNEMYGWDSYFETLGLLADGHVELAKGMVENFEYQIHYYGKILNANRSYYLTRSQPPFVTDMALSVYRQMSHITPAQVDGHREWLRRAILYAIKEYYTVWMSQPRYNAATQLSLYHPTGIGMPPETESTHFNHVLEPYAHKHGVDLETFKRMYDAEEVSEPALDRYFVHDRAVRESGHDTTYRLEKRCADLATVDLNALLYKYEKDIAFLIDHEFGGSLTVPTHWAEGTPFEQEVSELPKAAHDQIPESLTTRDPNTTLPMPVAKQEPCHFETSALWTRRAAQRLAKMNELMWDEERGLWFDFNTNTMERSTYESVTTLWMLWAGAATQEQVQLTIDRALPLFEVLGGLVSGTERSRGTISLERPNRQWDYPLGWAPHQLMAWRGFEKYGHHDITTRLAYRWLYTITKAFVDFNGCVPEKFDVVTLEHQLKVEYGNVGTDFKCVPREGFGWMNASYQVGLTYIPEGLRRKLGVVSPPDRVFGNYPHNNNSSSSTDNTNGDGHAESPTSSEHPLAGRPVLTTAAL
ncbi:alpha,alpha-trehalase nth1 [Sorochytrium milnesiophthora]